MKQKIKEIAVLAFALGALAFGTFVALSSISAFQNGCQGKSCEPLPTHAATIVCGGNPGRADEHNPHCQPPQDTPTRPPTPIAWPTSVPPTYTSVPTEIPATSTNVPTAVPPTATDLPPTPTLRPDVPTNTPQPYTTSPPVPSTRTPIPPIVTEVMEDQPTATPYQLRAQPTVQGTVCVVGVPCVPDPCCELDESERALNYAEATRAVSEAQLNQSKSSLWDLVVQKVDGWLTSLFSILGD